MRIDARAAPLPVTKTRRIPERDCLCLIEVGVMTAPQHSISTGTWHKARHMLDGDARD
jgi:hypothetical protein